MSKNLFFFLLVSLLLINNAKSQQKLFFSIDGSVYSIWVTNINRTEYFSFDLSSNVGKGFSITNNFIYKFGKNTFLFLPGSQFFIFQDKFGNQHHFQMLRPTFILSNLLYIPLRSFLDCLSNSNLFQTSFSPRSFAFVFKEVRNEIRVTKSSNDKKEIPLRTKEFQVETQFSKEMTETYESKSTPKFVLTNNERFVLSNQNERKKQEVEKRNSIEKRNNREKDTTGKIPPKYYILPSELKNSPK